MNLPIPHKGLLESTLAGLLNGDPAPAVVGVRCGGWSNGEELTVRGRRCRLHWCPSALAVREVLSETPGDGETVVVLTDRSEDELGLDVTARLARRRLVEINVWDTLKQRFGATRIDPRLSRRHGWLAEGLLESLPPGGYSQVSSGILDLDSAWRAYLEHRLQLAEAASDIAALLCWATAPGLSLIHI